MDTLYMTLNSSKDVKFEILMTTKSSLLGYDAM
jgi:hypothetical protein